jgi:hypothetical protein
LTEVNLVRWIKFAGYHMPACPCYSIEI